MSRASGYSASTLTVVLAESITLNSKDYGSTQSFSISGISNIHRRIVTVTTAEAVIMTMNPTAMGPGQYIDEKVKYMRFTNLDDTNFITLTFRNQDNDEVAIKLETGKSFIWAGDDSDGMNLVMNATEDADAASSTNFGSLTNIQADADTGSCDLEIFVAEVA